MRRCLECKSPPDFRCLRCTEETCRDHVQNHMALHEGHCPFEERDDNDPDGAPV